MFGIGIGMSLWGNVAVVSGGSTPTTWDTVNSSTAYSYSNANKTATCGSSASNYTVVGSKAHSGTGDWSYDVTLTGNQGSFIGLATGPIADGNTPVAGSTALVQWWTADGNVWKGGASVATPSTGLSQGDTVRVRLENGKLYLGKVVTGTVTWYLGDPVAQTGGYDVSAMGPLYPACTTNNAETFASDFTLWP